MVSGVGHGSIARHNARGLALILRQPGDIGGYIMEKLSFKRHGYVEEGLQVNKIRKPLRRLLLWERDNERLNRAVITKMERRELGLKIIGS